MADLNRLVDETTKIKDELVTCRANLQSNLIKKGIECLKGDKLTNLVAKVNDIIVDKYPNLPPCINLSDIWLSIENLPDFLENPNCETVGDYIYIMGGNKFGKGAQTKVYRYDTKTNSYSIETDLPIRGYGFSHFEYDNKIYIIGGIDYDHFSGNECYDVKTKTWTTKTPLSEKFYLPAFGSIKGKFYIVGGRASGSGMYNSNRCYNPVTDTWSYKTGFEYGRGDMKSAVALNKLYIADGIDASMSDVNNMKSYNPDTDTWTVEKSSFHIDKNCYFISSKNKIYIIGGEDKSNYSHPHNKVFVFNPVDGSYSRKNNLPIERARIGGATHKDNIYIFGGDGVSGKGNLAFCYIV